MSVIKKPIMSKEQPPVGTSLSLNLNSILSFVVLGVVGWIGMKTAGNADTLIKIETSQPYLTQTITELKTQLQTLVTRAEFDSRLAEAKAERVSLESRIHTLEIEAKITSDKTQRK